MFYVGVGVGGLDMLVFRVEVPGINHHSVMI